MKIYTPFPDYEVEVPLTGSSTTRTTYRLAGQMVAIQHKIGAAGTFYYTYTDHLGNVAALSWTGGTVVPNSLARFDPFGNYRTLPSTNPGTTNHGFTGHRHNNTGAYPTLNVGLIYMNARYYLPEVGRFISADSIVPDPGNPQNFNRYSYTLNSPLNFADPSGHCAGDPSNNNPFSESGDSIANFDCTLNNFDALPIADRLRWMELLMRQTGTIGCFNNIVGIIQGFVNYGLAGSGSWLSMVDAAILQGIQDGYASSNQAVQDGIAGNASSANPGKAAWANFFNEAFGTADEDLLKSYWGIAERDSTQHGEEVAAARNMEPNAAEQVFLTTGNVYRWAAFNGGLGKWALTVSPIFRVNPIVAYAAGDWFNDPRSADPLYGRAPVYWYSTAIWEVQSWFTQ